MEWESVETKKPNKHKGKRRGCLTVAIVLVVVALAGVVIRSCSRDEPEKLDWPTEGLATLLPDPPTEFGSVSIDTEDMLSADIDEVSSDAFSTYMDACEEKGFTVDVQRDSDGFDAFTENGEHLQLSYYDSQESISIHLDAAVEMSEIVWPTSGPAAALPVPPSLMGNVAVNSSSQYVVTIGEMTQEQYASYVDECANAGFNVDFNRGDTSFQADNESGAHASIAWIGAGMMKISVDAPDDQSQSIDAADTNSSASEQQSPSSSSSSSDGMRSDFKEAVDSYEQFFNEYADFMQAYSQAGAPASMALEYAQMTAQYADYMSKLSALDDGSLSTEELAYFTEAQNRINQRLIEVGVQLQTDM